MKERKNERMNEKRMKEGGKTEERRKEKTERQKIKEDFRFCSKFGRRAFLPRGEHFCFFSLVSGQRVVWEGTSRQ